MEEAGTLQNTSRKKPKKELGGRWDMKEQVQQRGDAARQERIIKGVSEKLMKATRSVQLESSFCSLEIMMFGSCTKDSIGHKSVDEVWH